MTVALGVRAGQALFGSPFQVGVYRAVLRAPDRDKMPAGMIEDLRTAKRLLDQAQVLDPR